jgi:hypothetical protein
MCFLQPGQKYDTHHDFFYYPSYVLKGGNRVATVIVSNACGAAATVGGTPLLSLHCCQQ